MYRSSALSRPRMARSRLKKAFAAYFLERQRVSAAIRHRGSPSNLGDKPMIKGQNSPHKTDAPTLLAAHPSSLKRTKCDGPGTSIWNSFGCFALCFRVRRGAHPTPKPRPRWLPILSKARPSRRAFSCRAQVSERPGEASFDAVVGAAPMGPFIGHFALQQLPHYIPWHDDRDID